MKDIVFEMNWLHNIDNCSEIKKKILSGEYPFTPTEVHYDGNEYSYVEGMVEFNDLDWLSDDTTSFVIYGKASGFAASLFLFIGAFGSANRYVRLVFHFSSTEVAALEVCNSYLKINGLFYSYFNDYHDQRWQSNTSIDHYLDESKPYNHLPITTIAGMRKIDVSGNVGRSFYYCSVMFVAGATMYFGEMFKFIDRDVLLSLNGVREVAVGANSLVKVDLFDIFKDDIAQIRERQKYFLEKTALFERLEYVKKHSIGFAAGLKKFGYT